MTSKQALLERWTAPIDDNAEHQLQALAALDQAIDENAASLPLALAQMRRVSPASRKRRHWAYIALTIVAVILFVTHVQLGNLAKRNLATAASINTFQPNGVFRVKTTSPEETLLMYGDLQHARKSDQFHALWRSDITNPAYYAEYVRNYVGDSGTLPSDCLDVAETFDPDNGYYLMLHAALHAKQLVTKSKTEHPRSPVTHAHIRTASAGESERLKRQVIHQYLINDPAKAQEVLNLLRKSLEKPYYQSHEITLHQQRAEILNRRSRWVDQFAPFIYVLGLETTERYERELADLLVSSLQSADFSTEEGRQLFMVVNRYADRIAAMEFTGIVDGLVKRAKLTIIYQQIQVIDTSALDPDLVELWKRRYQALSDLREELKARDSSSRDIHEEHGFLLSMLTPSLEKQALHPPRLDRADLAPMRYADHSVSGRALLSLFCLTLFCFIPFHLVTKRKKFIHRISDEVWQAVPLRHVIALTLATVVLPLLAYLFLLILTPLTGKEWNMTYRFLFPAVPAASVFLMLLLLPRLLVGMTMKPWLTLSQTSGVWHMRCGWVAAGLLMVPLLGTTLVAAAEWQKRSILVFLGICWIPALLWLLIGGIHAFYGRSFYQKAMAGVRSRIVGVCTIGAMILLSMGMPILEMVEIYWVSRDTILAIDHNLPAIRPEADLVRCMQDDLRKKLNIPDGQAR